MELFCSVLEVLSRNSDDHELYLKICSINKQTKVIAKSNFIAFNFKNVLKVTNKFIDSLCAKWGKVEELDLSYTAISNDVLTILYKKMPQLRKLNITGFVFSFFFTSSYYIQDVKSVMKISMV